MYEGQTNLIRQDKLKQNGFMFSLFNAFAEMGGLEAILSFIKFEAKDQK